MPALRCPVCRQVLSLRDASFRCENGHAFDIAREGYVNLVLAHKKKSKMPGDSKSMLQARRRFLEAGWFSPLLRGIEEFFESLSPTSVLDVGCGEGFFTSNVLPAHQIERWGADISKAAVQLASKKYKIDNFVVASSQDLPFLDLSFPLAFSINAPVHTPELARVLQDDGVYLRIFPGTSHLYELKQLIYATPKKNDDTVLNFPELEHASRKEIGFSIELTGESIHDLLLMTPYYWHATQEQQKEIQAMSQLALTCEFIIDVYRKRS